VSRQSEPRFRWLIFFDRERSAGWLDAIGRLAALGGFTPVFLESAADLVAAIAGHAPGGGLLLTSRLDNDDVIHPDFVADVRHEAVASLDEAAATPLVIDFSHGSWWDLDRGEIRLFRQREVSPYATLVERVGDGPPRTVFARGHNRLEAEFGPARLIEGCRALTLVHDRNLVNGIRKNDWAARAWLRIRHGDRYVGGQAADRILADFGVAREPG
jgi:hypothetical protein